MNFDCIVIGSGNAGSCAAISAIEAGCKKVLIIDKCPTEWIGGNGYFTAGAFRTVHSGFTDLLPLVCNVPSSMIGQIDVEPYTREQFSSDIQRLAGERSDPSLVKEIVECSRSTIEWLNRSVRLPFTLSFNRQAYEIEGRFKFWGGMALSIQGGGKGLIETYQKALREKGVELWASTKAEGLLLDDEGEIRGLVVNKAGIQEELKTRCVVLACGGFESDAEKRRLYLGDGWEKAKVRGTPYNTGDGFKLATSIGAKLSGDWKGCHSTAWDANAKADAGARDMTNQFTKSGYPLGIMVNLHGDRFVDEGEDYRNYTYAKFGRAILEQPEGVAFQIWDRKTIEHLRAEEYGEGVVEKAMGESLPKLAHKLENKGLLNTSRLLETIEVFNEAAKGFKEEHPEIKWDPAVKDGLSTQSTNIPLPLPKSNWALPIDEAPFMAVKVACGITFTFGGLAVDAETAGVISETGKIIPGLYCAGEMVGIFYGNYPGGSGLTAGAVFGRKAGMSAGLRHLELENVLR